VNYASIKVLVLVLATGGLIAACASGTDSVDFSSGSGGGATVSGSGGSGNGGNGGNSGSGNGGDGSGGSGSSVVSTGGSPSDAGPSCIPMCNADSDCQNSCPVAQTGINCCDTQTGLCYVASTPVCPMPPTDGGPVMPPY
jgi:hypothetical protein